MDKVTAKPTLTPSCRRIYISICVTFVVLISTIVGSTSFSSPIVVDPLATGNHTLESSAIRILRERENQTADNLRYLTAQEQAEQAQLQRDLGDLKLRRETFAREREEMMRDKQALSADVDRLKTESSSLKKQRR
jgi:septal ring factor EnvC (AmiA/AmiB activator)